MTKEELEKVVQGAEYDFLRENPHLGSNIMFLTLGGSHAYGTNVPGSDVDVRGVTGDSKYDLLGFGTFEQVVEQSTDTTIYGFRKLVSLLINCNPNVIEMLGSKPDNYLMVSPEGQMLLDNKALFLSKKALYSFGGYANDQLRRLQMGLLQNDVNTDMKEEFALRSVQRVLSGPDLQHNAPAEAKNHFNISIGNVKDEEIKRQLVVNAALTNFPLRDFKSLIKAVNATVGQFDSLGKRNTKKDFPHINKHAMHLVRLYLMAFNILERGEINTYRDKEHDLLMDIRNGKFMQEDGTYRQEFFEMVDEYEKRLMYDAENSPLPAKPDMKKIEELVMTVNESLLEKQYKR